MSVVRTLMLGALSATVLAGSAVTASAAIVCNGDVCWHTHERYVYPKESGAIVHDDDWHAGPRITFREHEGRGYWHGDSWVTLPGEDDD